MNNLDNSRRNFLKKTVAASAVATIPYYFSPSSVLASVTRSKNDRIPIGLIGAGGMGMGNMNSAKQWLDIVAIADVDEGRELR